MTTHTLKVVPPYFDSLIDGSKTFEVRKNDRGFQRGDLVRLWEYINEPGRITTHLDCGRTHCSSTAREITKVITFVYSGDPRFGGVQPGHVVLGLGDPSEAGT